DLSPADRCLSVPKLFFAYGLGNSAFFPLSVGATTLLERGRPTPASIGARVAADAPTLFFAVPTFYAALLASDLPDDTFRSVRLGVSPREPPPPVLYQPVLDPVGGQLPGGPRPPPALPIFPSHPARPA